MSDLNVDKLVYVHIAKTAGSQTVLKQESLPTDLVKLLEKHSVNISKLKALNSTHNKSKPRKLDVSLEDYSKIKIKDKLIFEVFGYSY